jgi:hypothetical protein
MCGHCRQSTRPTVVGWRHCRASTCTGGRMGAVGAAGEDGCGRGWAVGRLVGLGPGYARRATVATGLVLGYACGASESCTYITTSSPCKVKAGTESNPRRLVDDVWGRGGIRNEGFYLYGLSLFIGRTKRRPKSNPGLIPVHPSKTVPSNRLQLRPIRPPSTPSRPAAAVHIRPRAVACK